MPFPVAAPVPWGNLPTLGGVGGAGATNLDSLTDVLVTGIRTQGDIMYWDTVAGQFLIGPNTSGGGGLYELGGASGALTVGDGSNVPNPVLEGFFLVANQISGVATTAPTGGPITFDVRLMPGNTLVTVGTIAAGQRTATFTPYASLPVHAGQWFETRVTSVGSTTPGSDLTVSGLLSINTTAPVPFPSTTLDGLTDVTAPAPTNGQTIVWDSGLSQWVPGNAGGGAFLYEIGGASGVLAIGDGASTPNPVTTGYTLLANGVIGNVTTSPVGSPVTFNVVLQPAATVITAGTVAVGSTSATVTPFPNVTLTAGEWLTVVVTSVGSTTPGSDLTVSGQFLGPGGTSGGPVTLPALSASFTQATPATTWTWAHGLSFTPGARFEDLTGADLIPDNVTVTATTVTATFVSAQAGTVFLA